MTASKHTYGYLCDGLPYQIFFGYDVSRQVFTVKQYLAHVGARILKRKKIEKYLSWKKKLKKKIKNSVKTPKTHMC